MTETEWFKLKLLRAIYPNINPFELEKYFCSHCEHIKEECWGFMERRKRQLKTEELKFETYEGSGLKRFITIYRCFDGEEKDEKAES